MISMGSDTPKPGDEIKKMKKEVAQFHQEFNTFRGGFREMIGTLRPVGGYGVIGLRNRREHRKARQEQMKKDLNDL